MLGNINTALGLSANIPGINVLGSAIGLATGTGPNIFEAINNPFNPLEDSIARPDPILTHTWFIDLPGFDFGIGGFAEDASSAAGDFAGGFLGETVGGLVGNAAGGLVSAASSAVSNVTGLGYEYVIEATLPLRQYETRTVFRSGNKQKYPASYEVGNMRLVVYGDSKGLSLRFLNAWHNAPLADFSPTNAKTKGGVWNPPAKIKRPVTAVILAPNLSKVAYIQYTGCWITNISEIALDSSANNTVNYAVDLSVDDVFVTITGLAGLLDSATTIAGDVLGTSIPL